MDVKDAVSVAKSYVREMFADDRIINVGLEEIEHEPDDDEWFVTIGFSRPWDRPKRSPYAIPDYLSSDPSPPEPIHREYRVVRVKNDGTIISVKLRNMAA